MCLGHVVRGGQHRGVLPSFSTHPQRGGTVTRSHSKFLLRSVLLSFCLLAAPVHAGPEAAAINPTQQGADARYGVSFVDQFLAALGIIGTGQPEAQSDDDDIASFGIIGTGNPSGGT
jgi:hypothetical protein